MDRRLVLAGLAAATAAPAVLVKSALAQATQPATPAPANQGPGTAAGGGTYNAAAGQMGQAEQQWMQQTMATGAVALETSRIAQQKAQNKDAKQFSKFEVDEQQGLAEVLRSMQEPATASVAGNPTHITGSTPPGAVGATQPPLDAKGRDMVQKLQQAQAGAAFDKEYLQGQLQGHRELLQIQENFIKSGSRNREAVNVAKLARGRIKEHIGLIESIKL
jgi:putative membrane protein